MKEHLHPNPFCCKFSFYFFDSMSALLCQTHCFPTNDPLISYLGVVSGSDGHTNKNHIHDFCYSSFLFLISSLIFSALCALPSVLCALRHVLCSLHSVLGALRAVLCALHSVLCALCSAFYALCSALCALPSHIQDQFSYFFCLDYCSRL